MQASIKFLDLTCHSPDFDEAYEVFQRDIPSPFLEDRDFLRNRLRVRDQGPKSDKEQILVQDGYTLHLIVAKEGEKVIGALYGHLISKIAPGNHAVGFVTYISVIKGYRKRGIGTRLVEELRKRLIHDSLMLTNKQPIAMVYEVEAEGKEEIKGLVRKHFGAPLDIAYYQPALHNTTSAEPMHLWFQPLDLHTMSRNSISSRKYPADFVVSLVTNLLTMEYIGPEMKGFDLRSDAYTRFLKSIGPRNEIGFLLGS